MPRLRERDLKEVRYVSMDDFISRINQYENIDDKVAFATRYLLTYGLEENRDVSFYEALQIARAKIADASYDLKENFDNDEEANEYDYLGSKAYVVNPYATDNKYDMASRTFMAYPIEYLKAHAMKLAQDIDDMNIQLPADTAMKDYYLQIAEELSDRDAPERLEEFEKKRTSFDVQVRMQEKYRSKQALKNAVSATKSNFITQFFDSREYKAFEAANKDFNDPNHENYGDTVELETAGAKYLMHKLPNWNPENGFPTEQDINRLSGKSRARATYIVNLIKSLHENRDKEHTFDQLKYHNKNRDFAVEDAFKPEPEAIDLNQSSFQEELGGQVDIEGNNKSYKLDNSNEEDIIEILNNSN